MRRKCFSESVLPSSKKSLAQNTTPPEAKLIAKANRRMINNSRIEIKGVKNYSEIVVPVVELEASLPDLESADIIVIFPSSLTE